MPRLVMHIVMVIALAPGAAGLMAEAPPVVDEASAQPLVRSEGELVRTSPRPGSASADAPSGQGMNIGQVILALAIVIGLIIALRWGGQRLFGNALRPGASGVLRVLTRSPIAPRQQLMLVQVGRRLVVVADSGGQISPLCEITDAEEVASLLGQVQEEKSESIVKSFGALFGREEAKFAEQRPRDTHDAAAGFVEGNGSATQEVSDPSLIEARQELSGLMEKVRGLSRQYRRS